jgi:hypothetical protein
MKKLIPLLTTVIVGVCIGPAAHAFTVFKEAATTQKVEVSMGDKTATTISYLDARVCRSFINFAGNLLKDNAQEWSVAAGGAGSGGQGYLTKARLNGDTIIRHADMKAALIAAFETATAADCINNSTLVCGAPQTSTADTVSSGSLSSSAQYHVRCIFQFPTEHCSPTRLRHTEIVMNIQDGINGAAPTACTYAVDYGQANDDSENTAKKAADVTNVLLGTIGLSVAEVKDFVREGETSEESNDT